MKLTSGLSGSGARLLHNIGSALSGTFAVSLIGIVTFGVLARSLGPEGLGEYRTVLTLLMFAGLSVDFGLAPITLREISRLGVDAGRTFGNAVMLRLCASGCAILLMALVVSTSDFSPAIRYGVFVAGAGWLAVQLNDLTRGIFQLKLKQHLGALAETSGALIALLLVFAFAYLHAGTDAMLGATATGFVCTVAVAMWLGYRLVPFRPHADLVLWRRLVLSGLALGGSQILVLVQMRSDVLLLSILRGPLDVGFFDAPAKLYEFALLPTYIVGGLLMPQFVRDLASEGGSLVPRLNAAIGATVVASALLVAVLFVHAEPIVLLLAGRGFEASAAPLRILAFAVPLGSVCVLFRFVGAALEQPQKMLKADLVGACVAIALYFVLIPPLGFIGAAIGRLGGDVCRLLAGVVLLRTTLRRRALLSGAAGIAAAGALAALLVVADRWGIHWLLSSAIGGVLVCAFLLLVPLVRRQLAPLYEGMSHELPGSPPAAS